MVPHTPLALQSLLDNAGLALAELDEDGRLQHVNVAFERLLGWSGAELSTQRLDDLSAPTTKLSDRHTVARSIVRREPTSLELLWRRRRGGPLRVQLDVVPAERGGFFALAQDAVEHRARMEAAGRSSDRLEASRRVTSTFLAHVSHELRTPLHAVIGFAEMIEQDGNPQPATTADHAQHILASSRHLLAILDDMLDLARIANNELVLLRAPVDIRALVRRVVRTMARRAADFGIAIDLASPAAPLPINADERRVAQVLRIVLDNAIKFTPRGGKITIRTQCDHGQLTIAVHDTGRGMSPAEVELALLPFLQVDSSSTREREGTGIGLPIAKALVELHGGEFIVDSESDAGTAVRITLPCPPSLSNAGDRDEC